MLLPIMAVHADCLALRLSEDARRDIDRTEHHGAPFLNRFNNFDCGVEKMIHPRNPALLALQEFNGSRLSPR
jgi:hypothetical protein